MLAFGVLLIAAAALAAPAAEHVKPHQVARNFPAPRNVEAVKKPSHVVHQQQQQQQQQQNLVVKSQVSEHVQRVANKQNVPTGESVVSSRSARIIKQDMEVNPDGSHFNVWSSDNGIEVQERGVVQQVDDVAVPVSQGEISYVDNEGNKYHLTYVADQFGFRAKGDHLPTPPPLPAAIARGLEYIKAHPYVQPTDHKDSEKPQKGQAPVVVDN